MKVKKYLKGFLFSLIITLSIVTILMGLTGLEENIEKLRTFQIKYAFISMFLIFLKWIIETIIMKVSLFDNKKDINYIKTFKITILGNFFNYLTPFFTGGQPLQVYYLSKEGINPSVSTASILYKSMIFQIIMALFGVSGAIYAFNFLDLKSFSLVFIGTIFNGFVVFLILLFSLNEELSKKVAQKVTFFLKKIKIIKNPEKIMDKIFMNIEEFIKFFKENSKKIIQFLIVLFLSSLQLMAYVLTIVFILKGFGVNIDLDLIFKGIILDIGAAIVPTPGTAGGAEGFYYLIFSNDTDIYTINSAVLIWRLTTYYFVLFIGALTFVFTHSKKIGGD